MPPLSLLAQGAASPVNNTARDISLYVLLFVVFGIWWVLLIRPQRKQEQKVRDMVANLKAGDRVVTTGGLYGVVQQVSEQSVKLKIADNVKVEVARSHIAGQQPKPKED